MEDSEKPVDTGTTDAKAGGGSAAEILSQHRAAGKRGPDKRPRAKRSHHKAPERQRPVADELASDILRENLKIVRDTVKAVIGAIDSGVCRRVVRKGRKLKLPEDFISDIWQDVGLTAEEMKCSSECVATIVSRHDWMLKYAPEVMLCCVVGSYSVRVMHTFSRLDNIAAEMAKQTAAAEPAPFGPKVGPPDESPSQEQ